MLVKVVTHLCRWLLLGVVVGVLAGLSSAVFLQTLEWATDTVSSTAGCCSCCRSPVWWSASSTATSAAAPSAGNNLIIDEIHEPTAWVPRRMAPLVFGGTVVTQLFGGSAGREGTAIQMSGSLTEPCFAA